MKILTAIIIFLTTSSNPALSQEQTKEENETNETTKEKPTAPAQIKPYSDVITSKAISQKGMFGVHQVGDKYLFEIPKSLIGREVLLVVRTVKTGEEPDTAENPLVKPFSGGICPAIKRRIYLRSPYIYNRVDKSDLFRSFSNSFVEPIFYSFDIKAFGLTHHML
ncbi:hypothetical protein MASR2M69_18360 [Bacteroidota bacterium]